MATDSSNVFKEISSWSSYDLFRLMTAIGQRLEDSERVLLIKRHLRVGQTISYYLPEQDCEVQAVLTKIMRHHALVEDVETGKKWNIPYCSINIEPVDLDRRLYFRAIQATRLTSLRETPLAAVVKPTHLAVGDDVKFLDRKQEAVFGKIVALHDRTATVSSKGTYWRMAYDGLIKLDLVKPKTRSRQVAMEDAGVEI